MAAIWNEIKGLMVLITVLYNMNIEIFNNGWMVVSFFFTFTALLTTKNALTVMETQIINNGNHNSNVITAILSFWREQIMERTLPSILILLFVVMILHMLNIGDDDGSGIDDEEGIFAGIGFYLNWWFINKKENVFAKFEKISILRHMWIFSVIVQFYLIYPFYLLFCYYFSYLIFPDRVYAATNNDAASEPMSTEMKELHADANANVNANANANANHDANVNINVNEDASLKKVIIRRKSLYHTMIAVGSLSIICYYYYYYHYYYNFDNAKKLPLYVFYYSTFNYIPEFAIGSILAVIMKLLVFSSSTTGYSSLRNQTNDEIECDTGINDNVNNYNDHDDNLNIIHLSDFNKRIAQFIAIIIILSIFIYILIPLSVWNEGFGRRDEEINYFNLIIGCKMVSIGIGISLFATSLDSNSNSGNMYLQYLGDISFQIYIWHLPILLLFHGRLPIYLNQYDEERLQGYLINYYQSHENITFSDGILAIVSFVMIFLVASLVHFKFEKTVNDYFINLKLESQSSGNQAVNFLMFIYIAFISIAIFNNIQDESIIYDVNHNNNNNNLNDGPNNYLDHHLLNSPSFTPKTLPYERDNDVDDVGGVMIAQRQIDRRVKGEMITMSYKFIGMNDAGMWDMTKQMHSDNPHLHYLLIEPICRITEPCAFCCEINTFLTDKRGYENFTRMHIVLLSDPKSQRIVCENLCPCLYSSSCELPFVREGFTLDIVDISDAISLIIPKDDEEKRFAPPVYFYERHNMKSNSTLSDLENSLLGLGMIDAILSVNPKLSMFFNANYQIEFEKAKRMYQTLKNTTFIGEEDEKLVKIASVGDSVAWRIYYLLDGIKTIFNMCYKISEKPVNKIEDEASDADEKYRKLMNRLKFYDMGIPGGSIFHGQQGNDPEHEENDAVGLNVNKIIEDIKKNNITNVILSDTRFFRQVAYFHGSGHDIFETFGIKFISLLKRLDDAGIRTAYLQVPSMERVAVHKEDQSKTNFINAMNHNGSFAYYEIMDAFHYILSKCEKNLEKCKKSVFAMADDGSKNNNNNNTLNLDGYRKMTKIYDYGNIVCPDLYFSVNKFGFPLPLCPQSVGDIQLMLPDGMHPSGDSGRYVSSYIMSWILQDLYLRTIEQRVSCDDMNIEMCKLPTDELNNSDFFQNMMKYGNTGECKSLS